MKDIKIRKAEKKEFTFLTLINIPLKTEYFRRLVCISFICQTQSTSVQVTDNYHHYSYLFIAIFLNFNIIYYTPRSLYAKERNEIRTNLLFVIASSRFDSGRVTAKNSSNKFNLLPSFLVIDCSDDDVVVAAAAGDDHGYDGDDGEYTCVLCIHTFSSISLQFFRSVQFFFLFKLTPVTNSPLHMSAYL